MKGVITSVNVCKNPPNPVKQTRGSKRRRKSRGRGGTDTRGVYLARAYQDKVLQSGVCSFFTPLKVSVIRRSQAQGGQCNPSSGHVELKMSTNMSTTSCSSRHDVISQPKSFNGRLLLGKPDQTRITAVARANQP